MGADRHTEPRVLARYIICQLSYIRYTIMEGTLCQLLTAYTMPASAASDQANCGIIESKARYDIASHTVIPLPKHKIRCF